MGFNEGTDHPWRDDSSRPLHEPWNFALPGLCLLDVLLRIASWMCVVLSMHGRIWT